MHSTLSLLKRASVFAAGLLLLTSTQGVQAATDLPSLQLQVTIKRSSAAPLGSSDFSIIATPVVTKSADGTSTVYYNGETQVTTNGLTTTVKLVDGISYSINATGAVECSESSVLPPVAALMDAFNAATPVAAVQSSESIKCPSDKLYTTTLLGEPYVICTSRDASPGFKIYGSNLDVDVTYLSSKVEISKPQVTDLQAALCAITTTPTGSVNAATESLLSGVSSNTTAARRLRTQASVTLSSSSCSCKGKQRACLFVHGLGRDENEGLVDSFDYFGDDLAEHAPCCSSIKYASLDTVNYAWYSDTLQQRLCDLSFQVSASSNSATKTISDTIIVAHSMGNLMLAGAIATGKCKLDASSTWVSTSGPMKGSMGADFNQDACNGKTNILLTALANLIGYCPANPSTASLSYENGDYASADLNAKYKAAQTVFDSGVSAVMCSDSYAGIFSTDQVIYKLAGAVVPHKSSENDGIVEYQSCRSGISTSKFSDSYSSKFYVTKLNHMDTTFRHGDGLFDSAKMPVKWFECLL